MTNEILHKSEGLLKKIEGLNKFGSNYQIYPYQEALRILDETKAFTDSLPNIDVPENQEQLMQSELKRRLNGESLSLEQTLYPQYRTFDSVVSMHGIPKSDIDGLKDWLVFNKDETINAIQRLYKTKDTHNYELPISFDIPGESRRAEKISTTHIQKYHKELGKLLQDLTQVGGFLNKVKAVASTTTRSYFQPWTNTLVLAMSNICFAKEEDGDLQIRERELIRLYGHEGMGHALNLVVTKSNGLPYFLTRDSQLTIATMESVAQFYERVILEDLKKSPETQKALGIENKFEEIYQEAKDSSQLEEYNRKLFQYAITVLADKKLGDPKDPSVMKQKMDLLTEVTINPTFPFYMVENHRDKFDSQGNLDANIVSELRYCAQPVQRALEEFAKQGIYYEGKNRSLIDATLLKGFWTPIGFVDNARLRAQNK